MTPRVAIVYLAYNSRPYLRDVIESVEKLDYPRERLEFIVVDNDSPDNSAEMIRTEVVSKSQKTLPRVVFFPNSENIGFAAGNNIGINHALLEGVDYVFLLNNDAKLRPETIKEAVALAETNKKIGSVQSLLVLWQDPETVNSTGGMVHCFGFGFVRDNGKKLADVKVSDGEEIAYASGAAVLYRASALRQVGVLDPFLFLYHEDLELGWRLRLVGYKNVLSTQSIVEHKYEFKRSMTKFFWMERNRLLVLLSHLQWRTIILLSPILLVLELVLLIFSVANGWWKEKLMVYRAWLSPTVWRYVYRKRQATSALRQVSDKEIVKIFTGKIEHQETSSLIVAIGNIIVQFVWSIIRRLIVW